MAVGAALRRLLAELAARDRHMCAAAAFVGIDVVLDRSMMGVLSTIFYYHFRRVQREGGLCTEMTGGCSPAAPDGGRSGRLMEAIPTVAVPALGHDKTRGFPVINRP